MNDMKPTRTENEMSNAEIKAAVEDAMEMFEDTDAGIREAVAHAANRIGVTTRQAEKSIGW